MDKERKPKCWILLVIPMNGVTEMWGVYTTSEMANNARKMVTSEDSKYNLIRAWVEEREMNHTYASDMFERIDAITAKKLVERGIWK